MGHFMIFDVIFDVTVRLSFQYHKILEFWHHHCVPRVKICIHTHTNFQLNSIIWWHSNIIWMTFWTNLWSLTSYLASQYRLTPSKSQNVKILTSQSVFHPKKLTYTHSETNRVILLRFPAISWRHKRGRNFWIFYFWLYHRFSLP